jgi:hypothetical protein
MNFRMLLLLTLVVGLAWTHAAHAQASVYLEGSATELANDFRTDFPLGGTLGIVYDGPTVLKRIVVSADIQTRYTQQQSDEERFISALIGPRVSIPIKRWKLTAFADFLVGFARYRNPSTANASPLGYSTTDNLWGTTAGVSKQITSRLDAVVDYSFTEYGLNNGEFNPQTYSAGVVFHFTKR